MPEVLITELRTRFYAPGVGVIYRAGKPIGTDGPYRIVKDDLGFISATSDGLWVLEIAGRSVKTAHETHADALGRATQILGN